MNVLGYWEVLRGQRWTVVAGVSLTVALCIFALLRISPDGVAWRSPPVYVAKSTLLVKAGQPEAGSASTSAEYLAQIYAELAYSDAVRRLIDPTGQRELEYDVSALTGNLDTPLPLISVSAFAEDASGANALSNRVAGALRTYVERTQASAPPNERTTLSIVARPGQAEIFRGVRLTPALMLFFLGIAATVFLAFTRHNVRLGRQLQQTQPSDAPPLDRDAASSQEHEEVALRQDHRAVPISRRAAGESPRTEGQDRWRIASSDPAETDTSTVKRSSAQ